MTSFAIVAAILALATCSQAFPQLFYPQGGRIVGGDTAAKGQFPHQVAIRATTRQGAHFCGGSLISDQWVLTAAHCAVDVISFSISLGGLTSSTTIPEQGRVTVTTSEKTVHPDYRAVYAHNDIALVKLQAPVTLSDTIKPISLQSRDQVGDSLEGETVRVSGWGLTSDYEQTVARTLNFVDLAVISNRKCANTYSSTVVIKSTICTVGIGRKSTCSGDSGGPLLLGDKQIGVVSFGSSAGCERGYPNGFVRVVQYLDWIKQVTGLNV